MEREQGLSLVFLQLLVIEIQFFPVLKHLRLSLWKPGAHREVRFGQIQRGIIVFGHKNTPDRID